jgi:aminoglycoside 3-N-acetyltransferase
MKSYYKKDIINSLKKVGVKKGQAIYINAHLLKFGHLVEAKNKNDFFKIFFESFLEILGKKGTLAINTHSFQVLRYGEKFIHEKTKSTSGEFADYIRNQKGSLRSDHPVFSVTAIGGKKRILCSNNSLHNYGYNSPFQKFLELDGKVLNLGQDPTFNPFLHIAEFLTGVPYFYNKLTKVNYQKNNKKISKYFSSSVRYLDLDIKWKQKTLKELKKELIRKKIIKTKKLGENYVHLMSAKKYTDTAIKILSKDQFKFIELPKFKKNRMPYK